MQSVEILSALASNPQVLSDRWPHKLDEQEKILLLSSINKSLEQVQREGFFYITHGFGRTIMGWEYTESYNTANDKLRAQDKRAGSLGKQFLLGMFRQMRAMLCSKGADVHIKSNIGSVSILLNGLAAYTIDNLPDYILSSEGHKLVVASMTAAAFIIIVRATHGSFCDISDDDFLHRLDNKNNK